jgi:predicted nucleic acid-binding protein
VAGRTGKPVKRPSAFWDSSALVPLCVRQDSTARAISMYRTYEAVIWWIASVEIASTLARLVRMKQLDSRGWSKARGLARVLADEWSVIQPTAEVRGKAIQLVDRYDLGSADALQLAAALEWCENAPRGRVFLAGDRRLLEAAARSGFDARRV